MTAAIVYVVEDEPDFREVLRGLLRTVGLDVRAFATAEAFLDADRAEDGPSCLLLDVRMPGMSGLELFDVLKARGDAIPVLFLTGFADVPMAVRALKMGATQFLEKPVNGQALLEMIQQAIRQDAERRDREAAAESSRRKWKRLTIKEREVLEMIRAGMPNKEIARRLALMPRAVELRRDSLMRKLGVNSLPELFRLTIEWSGETEGESRAG